MSQINPPAPTTPEEYLSWLDWWGLREGQERRAGPITFGEPRELPAVIRAGGLDPYRPDIVALLDFLPFHNDEGEATVNRRLLSIRRAMADLKVENVEDAIEAIKSEDIEGSFSILKLSYEQEVENIDVLIAALWETLTIVRRAKLGLDPRNNEHLNN